MASNLKRVWDNFVVIGEVPKSDTYMYRVSIAMKEGIRHIFIRGYYRQSARCQWRATPGTLTVPICLPIGTERTFPWKNLRIMIERAIVESRRLPIEDIDNAVFFNKETRKYEGAPDNDED